MSWFARAALGLALIGWQEDPWSSLWADFEGLRGGALSQAEAASCRARIDQALQSSSGSPHASLLQASLHALEGSKAEPLALRLESIQPRPFSTAELWFLADLLPAGPERARVVLEALTGTPALQRWQVVLAWNVAVDEARALRLEHGALPIQLALHERYLDGATANDLSLSLRALGQYQAADQVLWEAIQRAEGANQPAGDLWEARGINALGFGDETSARDYLGRALAAGSLGAGLLLPRLELMAGRRVAAREGFRALILDAPPPDWAWRGWGLSLLPAAATPRPTSTSDSSNG